jgi:REP element-mobilizing transposase RayT
MAQTLVSLYVHIIFSTKHRKKIIQPEVEPGLFAYIGGIANNNKSKLLAAGGTDDHVHLLASMSKNICLSEFVGDIKRDSSVDKSLRATYTATSTGRTDTARSPSDTRSSRR